MALPITDVNAITRTFFSPVATEVVYKKAPILTRLKTKNAMRFTGGNQIQKVITVGKLWGDAIGRAQGVDTDYITTETALRLGMALYAVNITLIGYDAMYNTGSDTAMFNQIELKFANAGMRMSELISQALYASSQDVGRALHIEGLTAWVDDGTTYPTIGGITRADIQPVGTVGGLNAYTAALTAFSLTAMQNGYMQASWGGNEQPDLIPATLNGYNGFWNALQPLQRYQANGSSANDLGAAGFMNFRFNAADVVFDRNIPVSSATTTGLMFMLNTNYFEWYFSQIPLFMWGFTGFKESPGTIDHSGQYLLGNQFVCASPRHQAKFTSAGASGIF